MLLSLLVLVAQVPVASADHSADPTSVTIAGSFQSELGCPADWQPPCATTRLAYDAADDLWQGSFAIPAGDYAYKAALNDSWDENYGAGGQQGGADIALPLPAAATVKFFYDHTTHWVTSNQNSTIATVAGSFQSELGCPGDWQPDCLRSWMQDLDGDGKYSFTTTAIPPGDYEFKVTINERWDESYPGSNLALQVSQAGERVTINWDSSTKQVTIGDIPGNLNNAAAHWVSRDTIAWLLPTTTTTVQLHYDPDGGMSLSPAGVEGGEAFALTLDPAGLSAAIKAQFPHLAAYTAYKLPVAARNRARELLKGQLIVSALDSTDKLADATSVQIPGVLDDLYATNTTLGVVYNGVIPTLRVWAPTARSVRLHLFASSDPAATPTVVPMTVDPASGVWSATGSRHWTGKFYLYEVDVYVRSTDRIERNLVTDPYAISLSTNSTRSQIVDLADPRLKPAGWDRLRKPRLDAPEDIVLYELHVRDFSAGDRTVPAPQRGTFLAFTNHRSNGMRHLRALARAGLTHIHLLPANDCASINEQKSAWKAPDPALLATYAPNSEQQQQAVTATRDQDGFNWCYDPFHYTTPEGSYATDPDGARRIWEFRAMVQALADNGLRVVMDVVYNHTPQSGQGDKSVLDKIVPGYYHRLDPSTGEVATSTCCQNTATEHKMMEKLMVELAGHLGDGLQGRRLPLRPDGPPHEAQHRAGAHSAHYTDAGQTRRRRQQALPVRRRLELRRSRRQCARH